MNNKRTAYLYLIITFCAWGSLYVVSRFVLGKVPVITVLFLRYFIAAITLFVINKNSKVKKIERKDLKYMFLIGVVGYFLSVGMQLLGIKLSNASIASLVNAMNPITIMIFAAIILKERLTVKKAICVMLAMAGVYIIIGDVKGNGEVLGILFSVFSVILWSFISIIVRKTARKYSASQITIYSMFIAAVCIFPFSMGELIITHNVKFDLSVVIALLYMGIVCTALAYVFWNKSLSILEAGTCSLFYPIQPMISSILGMIFLGEQININFIFGAILIIGGVLFSILGKSSVPINNMNSMKNNEN